MRADRLSIVLAWLMAVSVLGCGNGSGSAGLAAVGGSTVAPVSSTTPAPARLGPGGTLTPTFREAVAREFSPRLRFNGYYNDGNLSVQNRSEDFFPGSVSEFFADLEAGQAQILVQGSNGTAPGVSSKRSFTPGASFTGDRLGPYPKDMVGSPPGAAPLYVHVYEDPAQRALSPDGSGELVVFTEYWVFYPNDRAETQLFGLVLSGTNDVFGHRADWEHTAFRVRLQLGPGSVLKSGAVEEGYFYGHGLAYSVAPAELELLDAAGQPDPSGSHPVVYVAQGKHASYPQAGHWRKVPLPMWLADHTDFFRGNGLVVDTWTGVFLDLEDAGNVPSEFASADFQAVAARSPGPPLADWTLFMGHWGPDNVGLNVAGRTIPLGVSPTGPKAKSKYGDFGGGGRYPPWSATKRILGSLGLTIYKDAGITIPDMSPPPLPIRQ